MQGQRQGQRHFDPRTGPRRRLDLQTPSEELRSFAHAGQPLSRGGPGNSRFARETTPIVDNHELGDPPVYRQRNLGAARRAMPAGVADRLLRDAEERELDLSRQSLLGADAPCLDHHLRPPQGRHGG